MDLSLKVIRIDIHTDDLRSLGKLMDLRSDLACAERNPKTKQEITFRIGDHICIPVSVGTADTSEVQRIIKFQNRTGEYTCDHRNMMDACEISKHFFCFAIRSVADHKYRTFRTFNLIQNILCCLCRIRRICFCNSIPVKSGSILRIIFSIYGCIDLFFRKFHIINRIFHFTSLYIHRQVDKNRAFPSCVGNLPCQVQFPDDIFRVTDLYGILGYRLRHGTHIDLLKALLTKACNTGILIGIELSGNKDHRKRIKICISHAGEQIGSSGTACGICTAAGSFRLSITAGRKSSSLLMIAGMAFCMRILFNGIYQMCDHGSLISKEIPDPFFL